MMHMRRSKRDSPVIIIGAGFAGLSAAAAIARSGRPVTVLEARDRLGGRALTLRAQDAVLDLGAEFVHGQAAEIHALAERVPAQVRTAPEEHLLFWHNERHKDRHLFERLEKALEKLQPRSSDRPIAAFLDEMRPHLDAKDVAMLISYIEGFNAADVHRLSETALANDRRNGDESEGMGRVREGYDTLLGPLLADLNDAEIVLHARVRSVRWEAGRARVRSDTRRGERVDEGCAVIFTVPSSLLALEGEESLEIRPQIPSHRAAARALPLGPVFKPVFVFGEALWDLGDAGIGFVHSPELTFRTRWAWSPKMSGTRDFVMTAWSGGAVAETMRNLDTEEIVELALKDTARALGRDVDAIEGLMKDVHFHDWQQDPFSRGAYAMVEAGHPYAREALARPIDGTLFFAGEATCTDGSAGTVHGAIRSGLRAAGEWFAAQVGRDAGAGTTA